MKGRQVFVRAFFDDGRVGNCDVLDLDDESFRAFVAGVLFRAGLVTGIRDAHVEGEHIKLRARPGVPREREDPS
jgi:hypothetical protein